MISRNADNAQAATAVQAPADAIVGHRSPPRLKAADPGPGDMGYEGGDAGEGTVTREEMVKLFGNALRVR